MSFSRAKILVVDDNPGNRYALVRILRAEGYRILEGETAADALRLARSERPDLLVLDVKLPDMLGFEATEILRTNSETASISILNVSASYTTAEAQALGLGLGADGYLVHPIDPQVLVATVRALLRLREAERRAADLLEHERRARHEAEEARAVAERAQVEREELLAALRRSEARLKRLWDSGLIGMFYWTIDGAIIDANQAFLRMVGYSRQDLEAGRLNWRALTPPEWAEADNRAVQEIRTRAVSSHFEKQFIRKDGRRVDVLLGAAGFEHEPGRGVLFALDITDRKRLDAERSKLLRELEEALRARDEFLSMASHDLRGPLFSISLRIETLARDAATGGDRASSSRTVPALEAVARQVSHVVRILDDLLDVSRISSGRVSVEREEVDLAVIARSVVDRLAEQAERAGSELRLRAEPRLVGQWDPTRLDQVVTNLVTNALKFGAGRPIDVVLDSNATTACLMVRDRGVGISPEDQERIFERFERAGGDNDTGSFGLGLWIVQRIVDALGGTIFVRSEVGKGATFIVELPRSAPSLAAEAESRL